MPSTCVFVTAIDYRKLWGHHHLYCLPRLHSTLTKKNVAQTAKQEDRRKWKLFFLCEVISQKTNKVESRWCKADSTTAVHKHSKRRRPGAGF